VLYRSLHPANHSFENRLKCLAALRDIGYQVGTGVLIGLPGQTPEDLADDILFFRDQSVDMIGMGPYIPHPETPSGKQVSNFDRDAQLDLGLKMIALARLYLRDVHIASTTALKTLHPQGWILGLGAGANVIMPNMTPPEYKRFYRLYFTQPNNARAQKFPPSFLETYLRETGEVLAFRERGDSLHEDWRANAASNPLPPAVSF
jgi:biotin synthase